MNLIEGMKKLRIIEKRMKRNCESITQYSSMLSSEKPYFASEDEQKKQVESLTQANRDLMKQYLKIKMAVERTNLDTTVSIQGNKYTISELLVLKRKMGAHMQNTYKAMNESNGQERLYNARKAPDGSTQQITRYYSEDDRNKKLRKWYDLVDEIDSRLEVINATTPLMGFEDEEA